MPHPLVTQIIWRLDRGGVERMVFELARHLPSHGFRVRVLAAGGGGPMEKDFHDAGIPLAIGPNVDSFNRRATLEFLRKDLHAHWPAIWHTHLGGDIWGGWVARRESIHPWISTSHDVQKLPWPKNWLEGHALRRADHVTCISETVRHHVETTYKRTESTSVIRLGVKTDEARPLSTQHRLERFIVIGRLVREKRAQLLLQALATISEPWHLDIVGDGPERVNLERFVDQARLRPRVRFVGGIANIYPYLLEADVCLFASAEEGQGLVVLEAAGAGVPVIATDLPALRELFDECSMKFIDSSDLSVWAKAIQTVMHTPEETMRRAQAAQRITKDRCSLENMVKEYASLYEKLLSKTYAHPSHKQIL